MDILRKLYLLIIFALLLSGCYEDLDVDIDQKPVLCVNSLISAGEPVEVRLSRTWFYTDAAAGNDHEVRDAVITISVNGESVDDGYVAQEGDMIAIMAESVVYGRAEAEVVVPHSVPAVEVSMVAHPTKGWYYDGADYGEGIAVSLSFDMQVEMTIDDPVGIDNYYRISYVPESYHDIFRPGDLKYDAEPLFGDHIGVFESIMGDELEGFPFFIDSRFSGERYTLHLRFPNAAFRVSSDLLYDQLYDCDLLLTLNTISRSYYNWANYVWQREYGPIESIGNVGLGDPLCGYSNVSTGAGVVAAQAGITYRVSLKEFLRQAVAGLL